MSIEAMKLMVHELEYVLDCINKDKIPFDGDDFHEALRLGRQAIEQAERFDKQPTKILSTEEVLNSAGFYKAKKQEPVAWLCERDGQGYSFAYTAEQLHQLGYGNISVPPFRKVAPLYTDPQPKREWVGLTDEDEIDWDGGDLKSLVKAIEAKLKDKNT